ncbi:MAG: hypothetical protein CSA66_04650 [Proteobacteria bacterium]|nr:MAG: hypothetical protein CSA66_04650 [Pseudomonadota bacterium]
MLKDGKNLKDGLDVASIGIEMGLSMVLGYLIGIWIDGQLDSAPWGLVFGLVAGVGAAGKALLRVYRRARRVMQQPSPDARELTTRELTR